MQAGGQGFDPPSLHSEKDQSEMAGLFLYPKQIATNRLRHMKTPWRKLYILSLAGALSWFGSTLTTFAVILRDKDQIGAAGVSLYLLAFGVPSIFMAPISGWIVDRFTARQVVLPALAVMGASSMSLSAGLPLWWTPIAIALTASAGTMVGPAWQAAQAEVTEPADLPRVTGLMQATAETGNLFAPALGGILISASGYFWPFVIDGISFWILGIVFFAVGMNRLPTKHAPGQKVKALDGLKFVFSDKLIRALVILVAVLIISLGSFNVGEVFLIKDELHASTLIYGIVGAMFAGGSVLGSALTAAIKLPAQKHAIAAIAGMSTIVFAMFGLSISWHWWVAMVLSFIAGLGNSVLIAYFMGIIMSRSPSEVLGRVNAAIGAIISAGSTIGIVLAGAAVSAFGVRAVLFVAAIASAATILIFAPALRKAGKSHEVKTS